MKKEEVKFLNENLYQYRKEKGISQEELGNIIGVSRQAVYKWESGERMPDINNLNKLCEYFDKSIEDFIDDENSLFKQKENKEKTTKKKIRKSKIVLIILGILFVIYTFTIIIKAVFFGTMFMKINKYKDSNNYSYRLNRKWNYDTYDEETGKKNHNIEIIYYIDYKDEIQMVHCVSPLQDNENAEDIIYWNYLNPNEKATYGATKEWSDEEQNFVYTNCSYSIGFAMHSYSSPYELAQYYSKKFYTIENLLNPFKFLKIDFANKDLIFEVEQKKSQYDNINYVKKIVYIDIDTGLMSKIEDYEQGILRSSNIYYDYEFDKLVGNIGLTEEEKNKIITSENSWNYTPTFYLEDEQEN